MAARARDISRSRKAYSYYRPRPRYILMTDEEEMSVIQQTISQVAALSSNVNTLMINSNDQIVWNETPAGDIDGLNTVFNIGYTPLENKILVFVNGVLQEVKENDADYQLVDKTITFSTAPEIGSKILVTYTKSLI